MKNCCQLIGLLILISTYTQAQSSDIYTGNVRQSTQTDTVIPIDIDEKKLLEITNIRSSIKKQNEGYSKQYKANDALLRFLQTDHLEFSEEALYWLNFKRDPETVFSRYHTFRDTVIVNPIYLPLIYRADTSDFQLYDPQKYVPKTFSNTYYNTEVSLFEEYQRKKESQRLAYKYIEKTNPSYFRYTEDDFPKEMIKTEVITKKTYEDLPLRIENEPSFADIAPPAKFIPDRQYWTSRFESAVQFSQNYVSPNWHKGGSSNLNLFTKNHLKYDYNRDKIQFTNELEDKISLYNSSQDTLHRYQVGEDVFRIHSNFGYLAFSKWYYTLDAEFKTQLLRTYEENTENRLAGFLAPFSINLGVGMKYDLNKEFARKGKSIQLAVNMAPLAYTYMYSRDRDIDLGRHGFEKKDDGSDEFNNRLSLFGSTIRADLTFNFTPNVSWQSRLYYFTTYDKVISEFENTFIFAINRYFSTRIYMHLRFDDGVASKHEDFDSYFQVNELLSFGFNYRW